MALSGSLKTDTYGSMGLIFSWSATQSVAKNESYLKWTLKSYGESSNFYYMAGNFDVVIDGDNEYSTGSNDRIQLFGNGATTVASGSKTIKHNNDGSRSFSVYLAAGIYTYAQNVDGSTTFTLDKIARTPSAPTSVTSTGDNGNYLAVGETNTVKWSGASGVITGYDVQYQWNGGTWTTWNFSGTGTSLTWTCTNRNAGETIKWRVRAKNGSLASGWKESNVLTISGAMDIKVSNAWKTGSVWIKVNGTWKRAKRVWINVNGTWKQSK